MVHLIRVTRRLFSERLLSLRTLQPMQSQLSLVWKRPAKSVQTQRKDPDTLQKDCVFPTGRISLSCLLTLFSFSLRQKWHWMTQIPILQAQLPSSVQGGGVNDHGENQNLQTGQKHFTLFNKHLTYLNKCGFFVLFCFLNCYYLSTDLPSNQINCRICNQRQWRFPFRKCCFFRVRTQIRLPLCLKRKPKPTPQPNLPAKAFSAYFTLFSSTSKHATGREWLYPACMGWVRRGQTEVLSIKLLVVTSNINPGCAQRKGKCSYWSQGILALAVKHGCGAGI